MKARGAVLAAGLSLAALSHACSKRSAPEQSAAPAAAADRAARVGEPVRLADSTWVVTSAADVGRRLEPTTPFAEPKETAGRFVLVRFKVTSTRKSAESVLVPPRVVDDKARVVERLSSEALYVPSSAKTLGIELLAPRVEHAYATVFEVGPDAKNLELEVAGLGLAGDKRRVALGL